MDMGSGQLTWRERGWLWFRLGIRLALTALVIWGMARFGRPLLSLFAPFVAALLAAAVLNPLVRWIQRRLGWSRQLVTLVILVVLFGLIGAGIGLLGYMTGQELVSLAQNWDKLWSGFQTALDQGEELFIRLWTMVPPQLYDAFQGVTEGVMDWLNTALPNLMNRVLDVTTDKAMGLPFFLVALLMFVMATYFLTADYPYLRTKAAQNLDDGTLRALGQLRATALGAFGGYLKAQFLLSVGVFFILLAGFLITRQSYGLLLALGLAVLDFIPLLGAGTVMVPWAVAALFARDYPAAIRLMVIWGAIVVFRRVMEPKFVGDQTGLSPIESLVSIYVGMKLGGVPGMILGPIFLLVVLNLSGMGLFHGLHLDFAAAVRDLGAILARRPDPNL